MEENKNYMTITECVNAIAVLREAMHNCPDSPVKSKEYLAIESALFSLCEKVKEFQLKK